MEDVLITRISEFREKKNITQGELAEKVGVRRETISRLENGQYNPSLKLAFDIAAILDASIYDLFEYVPKSELKKNPKFGFSNK
ncbi:MAG: helix-turn-helix transcriptional regulator [Lachnospiraceae bacterium]|nr:helix-turn-helix transcriptional regulator [Lachnospiraceae bacterium]